MDRDSFFTWNIANNSRKNFLGKTSSFLRNKVAIVKDFWFNSRKEIRVIASLGFLSFLLSTLVLGRALVLSGIWPFGTRAELQPSILYLAPGQMEAEVGETFTTQVYLLPEGNPVSGIDVVLIYDSSFLEPLSVEADQTSAFKTFSSNIDQNKQRVSFTALAFDGNQPTEPVGGDSAVGLARVAFRTIAPGETTISFDYAENGTTESNISVVFNENVIDALEAPTTQLVVNIQSPATPTPTPTPTASPTPTPVPTGAPDSIPPSVNITSPADGEEITRNTRFTITADASDNIGVTKVEFLLDKKHTCTDTEAPYTCNYRLVGKPNKTYTIQATAYDAAGNFSYHQISVVSIR